MYDISLLEIRFDISFSGEELTMTFMVLDKMLFHLRSIDMKNVCCGYSLEAPHQDLFLFLCGEMRKILILILSEL